MRGKSLLALCVIVGGCNGGGGTGDPGPMMPANRAPEIGIGDRSAASVTLTVVMTSPLNKPTGLAFNPKRPDELWITDAGDDSFSVFNTATATAVSLPDDSDHFLDNPVSLSFTDHDTIATCQDSRDDRNGSQRADDHMGPSVFPASAGDMEATGLSANHLDMVHHTPYCMGVVTTTGTEAWVFNGRHGSLDRYDFHEYHAPGDDDHSDSETWRYAQGQVKRVAEIPSHLAYDPQSKTLYIADTGNGRIGKLDVSAPPSNAVLVTKKTSMDGPLYRMEGATVADLVPATAGQVTRPSGIALRNGIVFVSDAANGRLSAFDAATGELVNSLETALPDGAATAIAFGPDGKLYVADRLGNRVLRIDP